ncbi:MAG: hypothetical protein A2623_08425 [Caulobacterales bacterium RIFCSPHIGHO2_01_FULL_70_19]|nr:MAG: hypothetical protein A2623_08425 [Caulobacterales bacterium RIFCSPHIGHO2_01_FULL_70_19]
MAVRPPILPSTAIAFSAAAVVVGLLLLNGGLDLKRSGMTLFEGLSLLAGVLAIAAIIRHQPRLVWWAATGVFALTAVVLAVMVRYQLGCAERGACF